MFDIRAEGLTRDDWLDLLMTHLIQPAIPDNRILLVYDYPKSQAALARIRQGDVPVAERFELLPGPARTGQRLPRTQRSDEQRERFDRDLSRGDEARRRMPPVDERLLAALPALPDCAGVALGVDRLLMAMLGSRSDRRRHRVSVRPRLSSPARASEAGNPLDDSPLATTTRLRPCALAS